MTRIEALEELAAKVEVGTWTYLDWPIVEKAFPKNWNDAGLYWEKSLNGSLDAAKALMEAVLPGWPWSVKTLATDAVQVWTNHAYGLREQGFIGTTKDNPARAWLLAILRALIAQEKANDAS